MPIASRPFEKNSSGYDADSYVPETSGGEAAAASAVLAAQDVPTLSIKRMVELKRIERDSEYDQKYSPEELTQRFPGLDKPFTEPKSLAVAQEIYNRNMERKKLEDIIKYGPKGVGQTLANFGAAALPHAMDPIELGANVLVGFGIGSVAKFAASEAVASSAIGKYVSSSALGKTATAVGETVFGAGKAATPEAAAKILAETGKTVGVKNIGQEFAGAAAEGAIGAFATESATAVPAASMEQRKYGLEDAAFNSALGAFAFGALHVGGSRALRYVKNLGPEAMNMKERIAMKQLLNDEHVDMEAPTTMLAKQTDIPHEQTGHQHRPLNTPEEIKATEWHAPKDVATNDVKAPSAVIANSYGDGIHLTDNPAVANAASARALEGTPGRVIQTRLDPSANILNIDEPMTIDFKLTIDETAKNLEITVPKDFVGSPKQYFDRIEELNPKKDMDQFFNTVGEAAKAQGIDGYKFVTNEVAGVEHEPHNTMLVLNKEKLKPTGVKEVNPELIRNPTDSEIKTVGEKTLDPIKNDKDYNPEVFSRLDDHIENPQVQELKPTELDMKAQELVDDIKLADEQGLLTPQEKKQLESLKADKSFGEKLVTIAKQAIVCLRRNG